MSTDNAILASLARIETLLTHLNNVLLQIAGTMPPPPSPPRYAPYVPPGRWYPVVEPWQAPYPIVPAAPGTATDPPSYTLSCGQQNNGGA